MTRLVLKLPEGLAAKVAEAAEEADMLPTEWVRDLIRGELTEDEPDEDQGPEDDDGEEP